MSEHTIRSRRNAATPDQVEGAERIIRKAEDVGFVREASLPDAYDLYLLEDADEAEAYLDDLADNDPAACDTCGAAHLCDCAVYLVAS